MSIPNIIMPFLIITPKPNNKPKYSYFYFFNKIHIYVWYKYYFNEFFLYFCRPPTIILPDFLWKIMTWWIPAPAHVFHVLNCAINVHRLGRNNISHKSAFIHMTHSLNPVKKIQLCPHLSSLGSSYFKIYVWNGITPSI